MKSNYIMIYTISLAFMILLGCSHYRDVRPGPDGLHLVIIKSEGKGDGSRDAIWQAQNYCQDNGKKSAVFLNEETKYVGSMNEDSYNKTKTAAKVAEAIGGAGYVFGGSKEKQAGGVVGLSGGIADSILGEGYSTEMKFKCQ
jgi:hypothetical protein